MAGEVDVKGRARALRIETASLSILRTGGLMLYWAVVFFIIAIIAALFGFGGIAVASAGIAKILFFIFLVLFVVSLLVGVGRRGVP